MEEAIKRSRDLREGMQLVQGIPSRKPEGINTQLSLLPFPWSVMFINDLLLTKSKEETLVGSFLA